MTLRHRLQRTLAGALLAAMLIALLPVPGTVPVVQAAAGIYRPIHYQGRVSQTSGSSVSDGSYNMTFRIYDAATSGTQLWAETWNTSTSRVTMTGGLFSVGLGTHVTMTGSVNFNSDSLYLQVEFDPGNDGTYEEIFSPRRRFHSVPYAHNADKLDGLDSTQFIRSDQNQVASGTLTVRPRDATKTAIDIQSNAGAAATAALKISTQGATHILLGSGSTYDVGLLRSTTSTLRITDGSMGLGNLHAGAISGSTIFARNRLALSGALVIRAATAITVLYADVQNGRVGIGTAAPKTALEVAGTLSGAAVTATGLKNCDTIDTDSAGNLICGTDASGTASTFGSGNVLTILQQTDNATSTGHLIQHFRNIFLASSTGSLQTYFDGQYLRTSTGSLRAFFDTLYFRSSTGSLQTFFNTQYLRSSTGSLQTYFDGLYLRTSTGSLKFFFDTQYLRTSTGSLRALFDSLYFRSSTGSLQAFFNTQYLRSSTGSLQSFFNTQYLRSSTGSLQTYFDARNNARFVNTSGDTMTGGLLLINGGHGTLPTIDAALLLEIAGTASGRILHAQDSLRSSGSLIVDGATIVFGNAAFANCTALETVANVLTCGTDAEGSGGGNFGSGNVLTILQSTDNATSTGHLIQHFKNIFLASSTGSLQMLFNNQYLRSSTGSLQSFFNTQYLRTSTGSLRALFDTLYFQSSTGSLQTFFNTQYLRSSTGSLTSYFNNLNNARFVNTSGDTMTGGLLIINDGHGTLPSIEAGILLEVAGTMSGRVLHAQDSLRSSGSLIVTGTSMLQGQVQGPSGAAASPGFSFISDTDTGMFNDQPDNIAFAVDGDEQLRVTNGYVYDNVASFGFALLTRTDGSASVPTYSFGNDTDTGFFRAAANEIGFSVAGREALRIDAGGDLGVGIAAPGSRLSVSGATLLGFNIGSAAADAGLVLEIIGTASGRILRAQDTLASSGTLSVRGAAMFGNNVAVRGALSGASLTISNLVSCTTLQTSSAGALSCGSGGSSFGSGNVLTILQSTDNATSTGHLIQHFKNIFLASSTGSLQTLFNNQYLRSSTGSLQTYFDTQYLRTSTGSLRALFDTLYFRSSTGSLQAFFNTQYLRSSTGSLQTFFNNQYLRSSTGSLQTFFDSLYFRSSTGSLQSFFNTQYLRSSTGSLQTLFNGIYLRSSTGSLQSFFNTQYLRSSTGSLKFYFDTQYLRTSTGSLQTYFDTRNNARFVSTAGDTMTGGLLIINDGHGTLPSIESGILLEVAGTMSGRTIRAMNSLMSSGSLVVKGNATFDTNTLFVDSANNRVGIGTTSPTATLTLSGSNAQEIQLINGDMTRLSRNSASNMFFMSNRVQRPAAGLDPYAVNLAADNDYITFPQLSSSASNATVVFWIKPDSLAGGDVRLLGATPAFAGTTRTNGTNLQIINNAGNNWGTIVSGLTTDWQLITITFDGTNANGYRNGVASTSFNIGGNPSLWVGQSWTFGSPYAGFGTHFDGSLDEFRVYNRVLSSTEITAIYNSGNGQYGQPGESGLMGGWHLDDGTDTSATDYSGNGKTGTLTGGPTWVTGLVPITGSTVEATLIHSTDGVAGGEAGIVRFGHSGGTTILRGTTLKFLSNTTSREAMRLTSGGLLGLGTTTPGSKLSVSGSVVIGPNIGTAAAKSGLGLEVKSGMSGASLTVSNLVSCTSLQTSSAGALSCGSGSSSTFGTGNVLTIGNRNYVNTSGDTMTGGLLIINDGHGTLPSAEAGVLLEVAGVMSGRIIKALNSLASSGTLTVAGTTRLKNNLTVTGTMSGRGLQITGTGALPLLYTDVGRSRLGIGNTAPKGLYLHIGGTGTSDTNAALYINDGGSSNTFFQLRTGSSRGDNFAITNAGNVGIGRNNTTPSNTLTVSGATLLGFNLGSITVDAGLALEILGTASGRVLHAQDSLRSSGSLIVDGSQIIFGNSTFTTCTSLETVANVLTCGTDAEGGAVFGSGNVLAIGNSKYVKKSGDTMTGALTIQPTLANTTALKIIGTGSTAIITASGGSIVHTARGNPVVKGIYDTNGGARSVTVAGRYAYVADATSGLQIIDISNPSSPVHIGNYNTSGNSYDVAVAGRYAYVADSTSGLHIIDVSNPSTPLLVGTHDTNGTADGVAVAGRYAYVADGSAGLHIVDVSNPSSPVLVGTYNTSGASYDVTIAGRYAYVADGTSGLHIIDISNPSFPTLVGTYNTSDTAYDVTVAGRYAYVADYTSGLNIIDISNPSSPSLVGSYATTGAWGVAVAGRYAYVADDIAGLRVIDISKPSSPTLVGTYDATSFSLGVVVAGRYAYLADFSSGLHIVDINGFETPAITTGVLETGLAYINGDASIAGSLSVRTGLTVGHNFHVTGNASMHSYSGAALVLSTSDRTLPAVLEVIGTASGRILHAQDSLRSSGSLIVDGSQIIFGNSAFANCTALETVANVLTCGTDAEGSGSSTFGTGNVLTIGNRNYVNTSGDTMTGALRINWRGTGTGGVLLKVNGTMSGRSLYISGTGSSPLLMTDHKTGRIGVNTSAPTQLLHMSTVANDAAIRFDIGAGAGGSAGSSGPLSGGTFADDNTVGTETWSNPSNAASSNNSYATVETENGISHYLKATNFGFAIPDGATVDGIIVQIERHASMGGVTDSAVRIVKGGSIGTTNKASGVTWTTDEDTYYTYGASNDVWGETWTSSDINASTFGVVLSVQQAPTDFANVDHIRITVHYTTGGASAGRTWTMGTDYSDNSKFKLSQSSVLGSLDMLTLTATGSLGIGTSTPGSKLSLSGAMIINPNGVLGVGKADAGLALEIIGTASGRVLHAQDILRSSGSLIVDGSQIVFGHSNFANCTALETVNNVLTCGTDDTGVGGSSTFGTGNVLTIGNSKYVKKGGDTMTGGLLIMSGGTGTLPTVDAGLLLEIAGTASGRILHAQDLLRSSGGLLVRGTARFQSGAYVGGHLRPSVTNAYDLGSSTLRWRDLYLSGGTLRMGSSTLEGKIGYATTGSEGLQFFGTGGSLAPAMFISSGGLLGIGTSTPITQLHVPGKVPSRAIGTVTTSTRPSAVSVQGKYAYVVTNNPGGSSALQVIDVSNPSSPTVVGTDSTFVNPVRAVVAAGGYVFLADQNEGVTPTFRVFDVSDPANPLFRQALVGDTSGIGTSIAVSGRYAYMVESGSTLLRMMDLTVPHEVVRVASQNVGNSPAGIAIGGRYAYIVDHNSKSLKSVDIRTTSSLSGIQSVSTQGYPTAVAVAGRYAYVTNAGSNTLQVFDVSNSLSMTSVGSVSTGVKPVSISVSGRYAYVANSGSNTLQFFDVSNPSAPVSVGTVGTSGGPASVTVSGRYAYVVNQNSSTLQIFDLGGSYIQHLEAGNILADGLSVIGNIHADAGFFRGALSVGKSLMIFGDASIYGNLRLYGSGLFSCNDPNYALRTDNTGTVYCGDVTTTGSDYAEDYPTTDPTIGSGEVLALDETRPLFVRRATGAPGERIIGVMSTKPGFTLHGDPLVFSGSYRVPVALSGRVPVRVSLSGGVIGIGDALTLSSVPGVARRAEEGEMSIGYAIDAFTGSGGSTGKVEAFVSLQYRDGLSAIMTSGATVHASDLLSSSGALRVAGSASFGSGVAINLRTTNGAETALRIVSNVGGSGNTVLRVNASGSVFSDGTFNSTGADYAEYFHSSTHDLRKGELVCIDITKPNTVRRCEGEANANVMGIVSTRPAFIGNAITGAEGLPVPGTVLVGLIGQVPAKVIVGGGAAIRPGDALTSATVPGYARKALAGEPTVGVALEGLASGEGVVNVLISRRNGSATSEEISQRVLDTIRAMEIDDEVTLMVEQAMTDLNVDEDIREAVLTETEAMAAKLEALEKQIEELKKETEESEESEETEDQTHVSQPATSNQPTRNLTLSGSLRAADIAANTLNIEDTLSVGSDARIGGDLYLEGTLNVSDLFVPGLLHVDGGMTVGSELQAYQLKIQSGAILQGNADVFGNLRMGTGSVLTASDLIVEKALMVLGDITIKGLATFLGDVHVEGELSVSTRQAGHARIAEGQSSVVVEFGSGAFRGMPVVTASPDVPVLYAVSKTTQTGFVIRLAGPAVEPVMFSWVALTTNGNEQLIIENEELVEAETEGEVDIVQFLVDANGVPISSNEAWNACIRNQVILDDAGQPLSCARYHNDYVWEHPDLIVSFTWNTSMTPPLLVLPEGYEEVTDVAEVDEVVEVTEEEEEGEEQEGQEHAAAPEEPLGPVLEESVVPEGTEGTGADGTEVDEVVEESGEAEESEEIREPVEMVEESGEEGVTPPEEPVQE